MDLPGSVPTRASDRLLAAVDRGVAVVEDAFNVVAGVAIFALMLFVVVEVVGRRLFNRPMPGHIDIVELGMVSFAVLGAAYCQRLGGHVRMELMVSRLRGRAMWVAEAVGTLIALVIIGMIVRSSWDHFWRAWTIGDTTMDIQLQTWPSKLLVPVALALLWLRLFVHLWAYVRLVVRPAAPPMSVPMTLGLHEQAQQEIEHAITPADGGGR